jgi:hypothetical protein
VIAAVSDVFPWSTCPIVPTLQCGFVLSNFALAIARSPRIPGSHKTQKAQAYFA